LCQVDNPRGYPVAKEGKADATFLGEMSRYHHYKYFYGKETPFNAEGEASLGDATPKARDVYDPLEAEADASELWLTLFPGTQPSDDYLERYRKAMMKATRKALARGVAPEKARIHGMKVLDEVADSPAGQLAQDTIEDEHTEVFDSIRNAFAIVSSL
jgi:hypothetical protein